MERLKQNPFRTAAAVIFAITLLLMMTPLFGSGTFRAYSGGLETLDMRFGYGAADAYSLFDALGGAGRAFYARYLWLDFLFILSFAVVQDSILRRAAGNVLLKGGLRILLALPLLRGLFDLAENLLILWQLAVFPAPLPFAAVASGLATQAKFIVLGAWLCALPACFIARKRAERRRAL